jgi:hypothetical protein
MLVLVISKKGLCAYTVELVVVLRIGDLNLVNSAKSSVLGCTFFGIIRRNCAKFHRQVMPMLQNIVGMHMFPNLDIWRRKNATPTYE